MRENLGEMLLSELVYDEWANGLSLGSLSQPGIPSRAFEIMAHIIGAHCLWQDRIRARSARMAVWPQFTLRECEEWLPRLAKDWRMVLAQGEAGLKCEVVYVNSKGEPWKSRVADIIRHVLYHGAYHRGQIATLLGRAGLDPAYTDYIQWRRAIVGRMR